MVVSAALGGNEVHHLLNDAGGSYIVAVCRLSVLEVGVAVLRGALLDGMFGVERPGLEVCNVFCNSGFVADSPDFRIVVSFVPHVDFGNFVRGSETVEEVDEGNFCLEGGEVSNECEVHNFLYGRIANHCKTRLTASHNVCMVAEYVERMSCKGARGNVHNHGQQFA